jgi:hypothetical protein
MPPFLRLKKQIAEALGALVSEHYKAHICNTEFDTKSFFPEKAKITFHIEQSSLENAECESTD